MKNYVHDGNTIPFTPAAAVAAGEVIVVGALVCVAKSAGAIGELISLQRTGVARVAKLSTDVIAQGVAVYWDDTNNRITTTASGNTLAGKAWEAAGNGETQVNVILNA